MISEDIQIIDLDATHWNNLLKLFGGEFYEHRPQKKGAGRASLRIIHQEGKALKAIHSQKGLLRDFDFPGPDSLEELARREDVKRILLVERSAPRRLMHQVQSRLSLDDNMVVQGLTIYECVRDQFENKGFMVWPERPLRDVKYSAIQAILKMAIPAEELVMLVIFDTEGNTEDLSGFPILTSLVLRFDSKHEIDLFTTTDGLVPNGLTLGKDWRKDYKKILESARKTWGKVFLGIFTDLAGMAELDKTPMPGQAKALLEMEKGEKLIIDPFPMRLKMMLKMGGLAGKK